MEMGWSGLVSFPAKYKHNFLFCAVRIPVTWSCCLCTYFGKKVSSFKEMVGIGKKEVPLLPDSGFGPEPGLFLLQ